MKIFHVPGTRSVRPIWLCYELGLEIEVVPIVFTDEYKNSKEWRSISPVGKVPALIDGDLTMVESGAMMNYILERYGKGRLVPEPGTSSSALYHQWCWFAEATLTRPLGVGRLYRAREEPISTLLEDLDSKFTDSLNAVEDCLKDRHYLLGDDFTAADIMMGYSVAMVQRVLTDSYPNLKKYLERLQLRPAYQQVAAL